MNKKLIIGIPALCALFAVSAVSSNALYGTDSNSKAETVTQADIDALKEENEKLKSDIASASAIVTDLKAETATVKKNYDDYTAKANAIIKTATVSPESLTINGEPALNAASFSVKANTAVVSAAGMTIGAEEEKDRYKTLNSELETWKTATAADTKRYSSYLAEICETYGVPGSGDAKTDMEALRQKYSDLEDTVSDLKLTNNTLKKKNKALKKTYKSLTAKYKALR